MNSNRLVTEIVTATAMLASLALPGQAHAQVKSSTTTTTQGNLGLGVSNGEPRGYAFLLPVRPPTGGTHEVYVHLSPDDTIPPPEQWTWHVAESDAQIKSAVTLKWYAQASCPDDLTLLQVSGPGGTLTQNPLSNPIWGHFSAQSFTVETIKNVCTDWANANQCDVLDTDQCPQYEIFNLVGGVAPASPADRLRLKASCSSGPLPTVDYAAAIRLRCDRPGS